MTMFGVILAAVQGKSWDLFYQNDKSFFKRRWELRLYLQYFIMLVNKASILEAFN